MKKLCIIIIILLPIAAMAQPKLVFMQGAYYQARNHMALTWRSTGKERIDSLVLFRAERATNTYKVVPIKLSYTSQPDTAIYHIADSTVKKFEAYNYFLKVHYVGGRTSMVSDTIFLAALDNVEMPMPAAITTTPGPGGRGIQIKWTIKDPALIKMMTLYRSTNSVNGFKPVATLPMDRFEYIDNTVLPATPYFYYFTLEYKTQQTSRRGPAFAASFTDDTKPGTVQHLEATGTKQGIQLTWDYTGAHTSGFWLYRGTAHQPLQLVTAMIPSVDSIRKYTWTDTDTLLNGAKEYQYAIRTISTSHIESDHSDTASARPLKNIPLPKAPLSITAREDEGVVYVDWDDMTAADEWVAGYALLRSKRTGQDQYAKPDTIFCGVNFYVDSLVKPGEAWRYSVITHSSLGVRSAPTLYAEVQRNTIKPAAPGSLLATAAKTGVQLNWSLPGNGASYAYNIYRFERGQPIIKVATTANGVATYTDKTAIKDKQYFYFVKTVSADKTQSEKSNEAMVLY